jgi:hypothetical protein
MFDWDLVRYRTLNLGWFGSPVAELEMPFVTRVLEMTLPQSNEMDSGEIRLKRLHKTCEITLNRYLTVANDTCNLIGTLRTMPVSRDKRLEVFLQKKKEDEAQLAYLKAREALLTVIVMDPERFTPLAMNPPAAPVAHRKPRTGAYRRRTG